MHGLKIDVWIKLCYREIWPENDCFGRVDILPEEEFLALSEIFFADLGGE